MRKIIESLLIFLASAQIHAAELVQIPPQCQGAVGTVALIDCLRNQQEIISQLHEYYSITAQIRKLQAEQGAANAPPAAVPSADRDSDPEMSSSHRARELVRPAAWKCMQSSALPSGNDCVRPS